MHPRRGGRVLLELESADSDAVRYRVALYTPARCYRGRAVRPAGAEAFELSLQDDGSEAPAPEWLAHYARQMLASLARGGGRRGGRWPRRLARWRAARNA